MNYIFFYIILIGLSACGETKKDKESSSVNSSTTSVDGDNPSTIDNETNHPSYYVAAKADLWECDEKSLRQLVYIEEEATFYTCSTSNEWKVISLKGEKGEVGDNGTNGQDGTNGTNGNDAQNPISAIYNCGIAYDGSGVGLDYATVIVYKNSVIWIEAFFFASISFRHESCSTFANGNSVSCKTFSYPSIPLSVSFDKTTEKMTYINDGFNGYFSTLQPLCTKISF